MYSLTLLMICVIDYCYMNSLITYVFIEKVRSCNLNFLINTC